MINKQKKTKVNIQEDLQILTLLFLSWVHKWRNKTKYKDGGQYLTFFKKKNDGGQFAARGFGSVSQVDLLILHLRIMGTLRLSAWRRSSSCATCRQFDLDRDTDGAELRVQVTHRGTMGEEGKGVLRETPPSLKPWLRFSTRNGH